MIWRALLLSALLLTAGCLGFGDDEEDLDADSADEDLEAADDEDETQTGELQNETVWETETYEGTVTGTFFLAPAPPSDGQSFQFQAKDSIQTLYINLTTEGGDLTMHVADPDCSVNGGCEEQVETEGGEGQFTSQAPASGEWNVRFFPTDTVTTGVDYTADVAQGLEVTADA